MNLKTLTITLAALAALAASGARTRTMGQTVQPGPGQSGTATTRPDDESDVAPPAVTNVAPVNAQAAPRPNEMTAPAAKGEKTEKAAAGTAAIPAQPHIPTPEELAAGLLGGEASVDARPGKVPPAKDILGTLRTNTVDMAINPSVPTVEGVVVPVGAKPDAKRKLYPEGYVVRNRVGLIVRDQSRWMFVFESDQSAIADPPLILLPSSHLEGMLAQSNNAQVPVKFRITGEVTQYKQTNFLLLRMVFLEHNLDRF